MLASLIFDVVLSFWVKIIGRGDACGRAEQRSAECRAEVPSAQAERCSALHASASNGECPIQIDTSTPSCGNSRFGCWTCTVVDRDKASEGLLASGDERMEKLFEFRETLQFYRDPANGKRDPRRMNGNQGPRPLLIPARRELLAKLLALQEEVQLQLISPEELLLIQQLWKAARDPDDGRGVARIVNRQKGIIMNADLSELSRLREIEDKIAAEKGINVDTLRRMIAKVEEYRESHRA